MIKIQNINDASYKRFGKIVKDIDFSDLIAAMEATPCPDDVWRVVCSRLYLACRIPYAAYILQPIVHFCYSFQHIETSMKHTASYSMA